MIEIVDCEQGTDSWHLARCGVPTASCFSDVMASGRGGAESKTRRKYMLRLLGERITGKPEETYSNGHMERGKVMEDEARLAYSAITDAELQRVGFLRNAAICPPAIVGCSPDSLIGTNGMLEIKTKLPSLQLEVILSNRVPPEHIAQLQGNLWVAQREWIDFCSYWPALPPFICRVYRDEAYIAGLKIAVAEFMEELNGLHMRVAA